MIDYFNLVNATGGINGVKLSWEECETEYNASRGVECYERLKKKNGGAASSSRSAPGIAYGILDRVAVDKIPMTTFGYGRSDAANGKVFNGLPGRITSYWSRAAMIQYLGDKAGGWTSSRARRSCISTTTRRSARSRIRCSRPMRSSSASSSSRSPCRTRQRAGTRSGCRSVRPSPDYVILWGWGVMNAVAMKTAARSAIRATRCSASGGRARRGHHPGRRRCQGYTTMTFYGRATIR